MLEWFSSYLAVNKSQSQYKWINMELVALEFPMNDLSYERTSNTRGLNFSIQMSGQARYKGANTDVGVVLLSPGDKS